MSRTPVQPVRSGATPAPTPAPTSNSGKGSYGQNGYSGASSDTPGQRTVSSLAGAFDDPLLANVRSIGAKHSDNPDVFTGRGGKPTPHVAQGHKPSTPADTPKVPNGNGGQ